MLLPWITHSSHRDSGGDPGSTGEVRAARTERTDCKPRFPPDGAETAAACRRNHPCPATDRGYPRRR